MKINGQGPSKNRKSFPVNLNLVPFIDLFSMIIIFLIITAVFDQLSVLDLNMGSNKASAEKVIQEDVKEVDVEMKISVFKNYIEMFDRGAVSRIELEGEDFDLTQLNDFLLQARNKYPEKKDIIIFSNDAVFYKDIVTVMDYCMSQNFSEIIVSGMN